MRREKVLFFISSLEGGGAERVMVDILRYIDKGRINIILVLLHPFTNSPYKEYIPENLKIIVVKRKSDSFLEKVKQFFAFVEVIYKERPRVVLSMLTHNNIMAILAGMLFKIKVFACEHSTLGEVIKTKEGKKMLGVSTAFLVKVLYRFADKIIAVSEGIKSNLIEEFKIPQEKIEVIYNPIDMERINRLRSSKDNEKSPLTSLFQRGRLFPSIKRGVGVCPTFLAKGGEGGLSGEIPVIIAMGRLTWVKGFDVLIKAFSRVVKEVDARLIILGEGNERESLERLADNLGLNEKISFLGFQKNPYPFLSNADIFVLSSRYEGLPMAILEAMACGMPIIAADCKSGPREILQDGKCGLLVPVGDELALSEGILKLLKNKPLREKYSGLGKERVMDFSADKIVSRYEKLILESI